MILNQHYATVSNDCEYVQPDVKLTVSAKDTTFISDWSVFNCFDHLQQTSTGIDGLPSWFLKLGAPVFYTPLAKLYNVSIASSTVPSQWKCAYIVPLPKVPSPTSPADYRPISI